MSKIEAVDTVRVSDLEEARAFFGAIGSRISCRAFESRVVEQEKLDALRAEIDKANEVEGLHFQLFGPRDGGSAIDMNERMFAGEVPYYVALAAPKDPIIEEKLGYYGERLALLATSLGLGTCWVASTYDHDTVRVDLVEGEVLHDVMPFGYAFEKTPLKQRTIRAGIRARDKKLSQLYAGPVPFGQAPAWIQEAIEAVHAGPSAVNEQPVVFAQESAEAPVRATLPTVKSGMEYTDLGIAKLHFELAAIEHGVRGAWQWGEGGSFVIEA